VKTLNDISFFFYKTLLTAGLIITCTAFSQTDKQGITYYKDVNEMRLIYDSVLYTEGWHTLPQTKFWQQIMTLTPDSAIVNVAESRQMLAKISVKEWNRLSDVQQLAYRDNLRCKYKIADSIALFVTIGKKDFYEFKKVMPIISKSVEIFERNHVDPWYAQAILLIESPGKTNTKSIVGANGPFQLMKSVARQQGLKVNKNIDERTDVERSAYAASRLLSRICIPKVCALLDSAQIPYNQNDLWFRLLVLHAYHAGAGNVKGVIKKINPCEGGMELIQIVWKTTYKGFKNSSQNYSQLALAAFCNFHQVVVLEQQPLLVTPQVIESN
jgi:hypothetical protein